MAPAVDPVSGDLTFAAEGISFADAAQAVAIGPDLDGHVLVDWRRGEPFAFEGFELRGAGMDLGKSCRMFLQCRSGTNGIGKSFIVPAENKLCSCSMHQIQVREEWV